MSLLGIDVGSSGYKTVVFSEHGHSLLSVTAILYQRKDPLLRPLVILTSLVRAEISFG